MPLITDHVGYPAYVCFLANLTTTTTSHHVINRPSSSPRTTEPTMEPAYPAHPALLLRPLLTGFDSCISNAQLEFVYSG